MTIKITALTPRITLLAAKSILDVLDGHGIDTTGIFHYISKHVVVCNDLEEYIVGDMFIWLCDEINLKTQKRVDLWVEMGMALHWHMMGAFGTAKQSAPDFLALFSVEAHHSELCHSFNKYEPILINHEICGVRFLMGDCPEHIKLLELFVDVGFMIKYLSIATKGNIEFNSLILDSSFSIDNSFIPMSNIPIKMGNETAILWNPLNVNMGFLDGNRIAHVHHVEKLHSIARSLCDRNRSNIAISVMKIINQYFPNTPSSRTIAENLAISERVLQRHLRQNGTSYRNILDRVRRFKAEAMLARSTMPIATIAESLGYSEVTSFNHAFRRWTGQSPRSFRRQSNLMKLNEIQNGATVAPDTR